MANPYPFFAFCSAVLNDPRVRAEFNDPAMRDSLMASYGLSGSQADAAKRKNKVKIIEELKRELDRASTSPIDVGATLMW